MYESDVEQLMRDIHYQLVRLSRPTFHDLGLTPPRFHTLAMVAEHGPITMSEVHAMLHVSKSTVTALVDGLVADQLIARGRDEGDRRKVVLETTKSGRGVLERLRTHRSRLVAEAMEGIPAQERDCMMRALRRMKDRLGDVRV